MYYGLPYMGSKGAIAEWVISYLPKADTLYDLFCGGCAITHAAMLSGKFRNFIINDLQPEIPGFFLDAIHGKYRNECRWISREDFFKLREKDIFVKYVWSFGTRGVDYIYGKDVEPYKHALHVALYDNRYEELEALGFQLPEEIKKLKFSRAKYLRFMRFFHEKGISYPLQSLRATQRIRNLETSTRLQRLQALERLQTFAGDYQSVKVHRGGVIYCDIPYRDTRTYNEESFDYERFYTWCAHQEQIVVISSYDMPLDRFVIVAEKKHRSTFSRQSNSTAVVERLFVPIHQFEEYRSMVGLSNQLKLDF